MKQIGKVRLHMDQYDEAYQYSDGDVEEQLLEIVRKTKDFAPVLEGTTSWPLLYHLHPARRNVLAWVDFAGTEEVLEIGSGCGAVTGLLAEKCAHVDCNDISPRRSEINATRHADFDNIDIHVCNFTDMDLTKQYDVITLIGVLEYAESYVPGENPYEAMLALVRPMLREGGTLFVAIENKFGLKYWAGCKEDHTGLFYEGIEGYTHSAGVKTFSRDRLQALLRGAGFSTEFYYPMPDYKFAWQVFSDQRLPRRGDLRELRHNYDTDRLVSFDEQKVYDQLIDEGMFPFFANSFLAVAK